MATGSDYNLAFTRLIGVPLLSGVAALLGVLLISMSAANGMSAFFQDTGQPLALLAAAAFGLTPGLAIDRLQNAGQFKADLRSIETETGGK